MNLIQQLLVTPAALGLLVPATANTAEMNISGVIDAAASNEQVTSISQFFDVDPTDWAYQALANLIEQVGCVSGYPNGTFRGNRAMTRYEAAALLNACLDRITEMTDELRRLIKEFETELAVVRGRVDGMEARVEELEATQFSTATKISALATFVVGESHFSGSEDALVDQNNQDFGATTFNSDLQLILETSFTGKDLLITTMRAGNFGGETPFGGGGLSSLATLGNASLGDGGPNHLFIDKLFYSFAVGHSITMTVGPNIGQDDMLPIWPTFYNSPPILDALTLNGAPAAYNKNQGPGAGISWAPSGGFHFTANYVAVNGAESDSAIGGLATDHTGGTGTVQLGWEEDGWAIAGIYSKIQNGNDLIAYATTFTQDQLGKVGTTHAFGFSGAWQPMETHWIPSISVGWGINNSNSQRKGQITTSQSWSMGLTWDDAFAKGNSAGLAVGQPVFATALRGGDTPNDGNYLWECWYQFQISDAISVTPALIYMSRPMGQGTSSDQSFSQLAGLVMTSFSF
ncbi:MAG: iron uptake porin [Cyanobacteriota bacterium]|nr:iron uptake porin [Cyanobacteriota bacterium]